MSSFLKMVVVAVVTLNIINCVLCMGVQPGKDHRLFCSHIKFILGHNKENNVFKDGIGV